MSSSDGGDGSGQDASGGDDGNGWDGFNSNQTV